MRRMPGHRRLFGDNSCHGTPYILRFRLRKPIHAAADGSSQQSDVYASLAGYCPYTSSNASGMRFERQRQEKIWIPKRSFRVPIGADLKRFRGIIDEG